MTFINEKVIELKQCKHCDTKFEITDKDIEFYEKVSPVLAWKKYNIPSPTLCPECRHIRRIVWRNERVLYKRKCDFSWKDILSIISPDKSYKVYDQEIWHSDKWDGLSYGRNFNFDRNFFDQINSLLLEVPQIDRYLIDCFESEYTHWVWNLKNCYLCFNSDHLEDCIYCTTSNNCTKCIDCSFIKYSSFCYDSLNLVNCFNVFYSFDCEDSSNCYFISNCYSCNNCLFCTNLVNKSYCIYNKEYTKEEYEEKYIEILHTKNIKNLKQDFLNFNLRFPKKYRFSKNTENSSWNYIYNTKNSDFIFDCSEVENCKYMRYVFNAKNCMDYDIYGDNSELIYEAIMTGTDIYKSMFTACNWSWWSNNIYCNLLFWCSNCFWCVWLKNKSYCILNKQYTKEEYEQLVPKIIEHMIKTLEWWEFFPSSISPFWYNETVAQEYFPLTKEEAEKKWFNWSNYEAPFPKVEKVINASMLPENIADIPDDILNWAIECEVTQKPFRIIGQELEFYRKHNLPIPKRHPDQRHLDRMTLRNPRKLYDRKCDKCGVDMKTTYSPERPEIVYCQTCYNKEVY